MTKITMPDGTIIETDDSALALRIATPPPILQVVTPQEETKKKARKAGLNRTRPLGFKSEFFSDSHKLIREKMVRLAIVLRDAKREMGRDEMHTAVRDEPSFAGTTLVSSYDTACRLSVAGLATSRKDKGLRLFKAVDFLEGMSDDEIVDCIRKMPADHPAIAALRRAPAPTTEHSPSSPCSPV